jgi:hypothetical protein
VARKSLVECSFLIPIRRDRHLADGGLHNKQAWRWLDAQLYDFGGATRAGELYEGWYLDPDTKAPVHDLSKKYIVAIPRRELGRLRVVLREACNVFQQKCIYLSVAGAVEFVGGLGRETK